MSWLYWNLRVYQYDRRFQKVVVDTFWDGLNSTKGFSDKSDLQ